MMRTTHEYLVKGTAVLGFKNFVVHEKGEEFFDNLWIEVGFKSTLILASSWFDQQKYYNMIFKTAKALSMTERQVSINSAVFQTQNDLNGIYKFLMRTGGPKILLSAIPRLGKNYSNFSDFSVVKSETGLTHLQLAAPEKWFDYASWSAEGAATSILLICKEPIKSFTELPRENFSNEGVPGIRGVFEISY